MKDYEHLKWHLYQLLAPKHELTSMRITKENPFTIENNVREN